MIHCVTAGYITFFNISEYFNHSMFKHSIFVKRHRSTCTITCKSVACLLLVVNGASLALELSPLAFNYSIDDGILSILMNFLIASFKSKTVC